MPRVQSDRGAKRPVTFAARLKALREANRWTQAELARTAGLSQSTVSQLEASSYPPGWDTVVALAEALQVPTDSFR